MLITLDEFEKGINGYYIYDCVVRDRNKFCFIADSWYSNEQVEEEERRKWDPDFRPKRILPFIRNDEEGDRLGWETLNQWGRIRGGAALLPMNQFIAVELQNDRVFVMGGGEVYEDVAVTRDMPGKPNRGGIFKLKKIGGYLYACGGNRSVCKRLDKGTWYSHSEHIPRAEDNVWAGFNDIDGFDENDIYAVGGDADVWHYDGESWQQIVIPTNADTTTVCCGQDGNVYISCYEGLTFMGRGDKWEQIHRGGIYLGWKDMVWFEDRVWCGNDNGLWTIHQGKVSRVDLPSEIHVCAGNLYVNDGVLLMAGMGGAAFRENGQWHSIFVQARMEKQLYERDGG